MTTARSEKRDKVAAHRSLRVAERADYGRVDPVGPLLREVSDVWVMAKDGRQRIDPSRFPSEMRK
jgi:hypothetical protein